MPKRIPVSAAKSVAKEFDCRQVILLAFDGERTHIVTYGKTVADCAQAAEGGNKLKQKWGWPENNDWPARIKSLLYLLKEVVTKTEAASMEWEGIHATKKISLGTVRCDEIRMLAKRLGVWK